MHKEFICIICPNGCQISVEYEGTNIKDITGDKCSKGKDYVKNEITNPLRVFVGSVLVENGDFSLVSVKTPVPIPKKYLKKLGRLLIGLKWKLQLRLVRW